MANMDSGNTYTKTPNNPTHNFLVKYGLTNTPSNPTPSSPLPYPQNLLWNLPPKPPLNPLYTPLPISPQKDVNDPKNLWRRFHANQYTGAAVLAAIVAGKLTAG